MSLSAEAQVVANALAGVLNPNNNVRAAAEKTLLDVSHPFVCFQTKYWSIQLQSQLTSLRLYFIITLFSTVREKSWIFDMLVVDVGFAQ